MSAKGPPRAGLFFWLRRSPFPVPVPRSPYNPAVTVRIGVDTGGTFTDFVRIDRHGVRVHKVRTTPSDPVAAIVEGLDVLASDAPAAPIAYGSTVATNAVLERKGARVALVTTAGFEDVIAIGRQTRPELYNLLVTRQPPLVDSSLTFGIAGRLDSEGREIAPLDPVKLDELAKRLAASGAEIIAVCLLHSYANPQHEIEVASRLRAAGLDVCTSHEVLPEYREYERWSTTVVNAYVQPLVDRYLGRLEQTLRPRPISVMQSNGGAISTAVARREAVRTVLSGPAAGVVGARTVATAAGLDRVISFDTGGTSTDVSLIDGVVPTAAETAIGDVPVRLPVIDIHTVGAGRWIYRASRQRRRPARRSPQRRRDTGTRVLRRGLRRDGHRRAPAARPSRCQLLPWRPHAPRRRPGPERRRSRSHARFGCRSKNWPKESSASPTRACCARFAWSRSSEGTIPAGSRSSRSAAPAECMPPTWPRSSASAPSWFRVTPACCRRSACWWPTSFVTTRRRCGNPLMRCR